MQRSAVLEAEFVEFFIISESVNVLGFVLLSSRMT